MWSSFARFYEFFDHVNCSFRRMSEKGSSSISLKRTSERGLRGMHDRGYRSIGCAPCTRAVQAIEDSRAGRWWWENPETRECGLHVKSA